MLAALLRSSRRWCGSSRSYCYNCPFGSARFAVSCVWLGSCVWLYRYMCWYFEITKREGHRPCASMPQALSPFLFEVGCSLASPCAYGNADAPLSTPPVPDKIYLLVDHLDYVRSGGEVQDNSIYIPDFRNCWKQLFPSVVTLSRAVLVGLGRAGMYVV